MLKTVNTEFPFIEIWFMDQDNRPLEIEDSVNISLIVGISNFTERTCGALMSTTFIK